MEFIPFILFLIVWVITYKYFSKKRNKIISHLLGFVFSTIALFISAAIIMPAPTPEQIQQRELAKAEKQKAKEIEEQNKKLEELAKKEKEELEDIEDDMKITLSKASKLELQELKKLSFTYAKSKKIDKKYYEKVYDCIGQRVWEKNKELLLLEIAGWCANETTFGHYDKDIKYINKAEYMINVDLFDMSYRPFNDFIKSSMNNPDSFVHVKTFTKYFDDYVYLETTYRGTNVFGGIVTNTMKAKVNPKTHYIYDITK